ncbi:transmembrane protein 53 isoform X2 [Amborella trichopoda]|nr:transmembrane protein 53 isoform X2 [Amborella trichopoda]|eukprot:XP_006878553.2 transmembrane protein 53 isoform X2 [Amborella trichopoda]
MDPPARTVLNRLTSRPLILHKPNPHFRARLCPPDSPNPSLKPRSLALISSHFHRITSSSCTGASATDSLFHSNGSMSLLNLIPRDYFLSSMVSSFLSHSYSGSSSLGLSSLSMDERRYHKWHWRDSDGFETGVSSDKRPVMGVVLLGWLGAQQKHLKKYADWYLSRGIRAITFVVPVKDVFRLKLGLGFGVEDLIRDLTQELVSWLSVKEVDGRERCLLFHTFSNAGWLTYGVILENLLMREGLIEKIKGCVVDSGPEPKLNPQVWAAGFGTALLKKQSNLTRSAAESNESDENKPPLKETMVMGILEKIFSVVLKLPPVNQRLTKIISVLSNCQPSCPQLYLYSTADSVIPVESVGSFMEEQKRLGKQC